VLLVVGLAAFVGAGALVVASARADGGNGIVLQVDDVVAAVPPSTVAPIVPTVPVTTPITSPAATTDPGAADTTTERVDDEPTPAYVHDESRPKPVGLQINTVDVSRYPVRSVGLQDNGQLEVPDETEIGWYKYGATAGRPGATVLAAHVNWRGSDGPFSRLGSVEPGDQIEVALDDGTTRNYIVTERAMYGKLMLPRERIWRNTGHEELVLITCGGEFNPEIRSFKSNIVVYAVPVA
jgi:hypothetical protein